MSADPELSGRHLADLLTTAAAEDRADYDRWSRGGGKGPLPGIVVKADALAEGRQAPTMGQQRGLFGK